MDPIQQESTLRVVAAKLDALDAKLNAAVVGNRRRNRMGMFAAWIIVMLLTVYLSVAYEKFGSVDPAFAAALTQHTLEDYLPQAGEQLERRLKDNAPNVIRQLEDRVRAMPEQFAVRLSNETQKHMQEKMPALENAMYESLKTSLAKAKTQIARTPGANDEERFKALLQSLADVYGNEANQAIDDFHAHYASGSNDLIAHLDLLAENRNLDREQQLHRDIVQRFLVLSHHYEAESGTVDQTKTSFTGTDAAIPGTD